MQVVLRGTHIVDVAKLWKRGDLYQIAITRPEMIELLRPYINKEVTVIVAGVPFRGRRNTKRLNVDTHIYVFSCRRS
jgi:hypothetical protein